MPGAVSKKDLYIGKSLGDLNSYTEVKNKTSNVTILIKSAEKTFREAERSDELGDEERAYILFMKYFNVLKIAKTKPDYKKQKDYFDSLIGSKNQLKAIERAERLAGSLKDRYEMLEAKAVAEKLEKLAVVEEERRKSEKEVEETKEESASSKGDNSQSTNGHTDTGAAEAGLVTVQQLYQMLKSQSLQLLLLDTRPEQDFAASHIKDGACVSVPQEIVKPGSTVSVMEKSLPAESLSLWRQRGQMDRIILLDWSSSLKDVTIGTTLRTLRDALFKYDSTVILRQEPAVLEGGYEQWLLFYPMLSTNPHVSPPSLQPSSTTNMLDFDYPDFEDPKPEVPPEEPFSKKTPTTPEDINLTRPALPKVDRSTKPQIIPRQTVEGRAASSLAGKAKLNNAGASSGRPGGRGEVEGGEGVAWINNPLYPSVSSSNLPAKRSNLSVEKPTDGERGTEADVEFELSELSRIKQEKERELSTFKKERERLVAEQKARIARLKEEEGKLEELAALRQKEERDVADLLRRKRTIEEELSSEKERAVKEREEKEQEEAARLAELSRIQAEEKEKKRRQEEVERLRQDRKKKEEDRKKVEAQEKEARENAERIRQEEEAMKERQLREASEMADKLRAEEEKAKLAKEEEERKKDEEERKKTEEMVKKDEEKTLAAKLDQEKKERLEKERREKEKQEREQREKERQERERQDKERVEKERQERMERERQEKEKQERERQEREKQRAEQAAREAEEKAKAERARQDAKQDARSEGTEHLQPKMIPSTNLPAGWEKRWDRATNRYFYINHNLGTTQWEPPPSPHTPSATPGTYKTRLKEEPDVPTSRGLSRSHSSPDIMKLLEEESAKPSVPLVDRSKKPSLRVDTQSSARSISQQRYMARKRDFNPVYGNVGPALTGLRNLGNTCYMNSTIQCLANTPQLVTFFLTDQYIPFINRDGSESYNGEVVDEFAAVVKALWCGTFRCIVPRDFKLTVGRYNKMFGTFDQQDSQEFLTFLLDGLHEGLNEVRERPQIPEQNNDNLPDTRAAELAWEHHKRLHSSIIVELFQGQLRYTNTCEMCGFQSKTFQAFMFLSLPLPNTSRITLKDCLNKFLKPERVSDWNCPRCKVPRHAQKKIDIWKLPRILIICLMRFSCSGYGLLVEKICDYVDFPVTGLDLREQVVGQRSRTLYNLYGISNHFGSTGGGHYTAVCRNPCSLNWHKFDDSEVTEIPPSKIKSSAAYLLFYTSLDSVNPQIKTHM